MDRGVPDLCLCFSLPSLPAWNFKRSCQAPPPAVICCSVDSGFLTWLARGVAPISPLGVSAVPPPLPCLFCSLSVDLPSLCWTAGLLCVNFSWLCHGLVSPLLINYLFCPTRLRTSCCYTAILAPSLQIVCISRSVACLSGA